MVISLTVILIECTGNVQYGLPIMVTLIASYMVGNIFNEGLYDIHIHINHYPLLEWDPPHWYNLLTAADVMTDSPLSLRRVEKAGTILEALHNTSHNGFPVVQYSGTVRGAAGRGGSSRVLSGFMLRKQLCVMLSDRYKARLLRPADQRPAPAVDEFAARQTCLANPSCVAGTIEQDQIRGLIGGDDLGAGLPESGIDLRGCGEVDRDSVSADSLREIGKRIVDGVDRHFCDG